MKKILKLPPMPMREFDRRAEAILKQLQRTLLPEHASDYVAINVETGEHVLGPTKEQVQEEFSKSWPDALPFLCRVDGGPVVKFYGR